VDPDPTVLSLVHYMYYPTYPSSRPRHATPQPQKSNTRILRRIILSARFGVGSQEAVQLLRTKAGYIIRIKNPQWTCPSFRARSLGESQVHNHRRSNVFPHQTLPNLEARRPATILRHPIDPLGTPAARGQKRARDPDHAHACCAAESARGQELLDAALSLYAEALLALTTQHKKSERCCWFPVADAENIQGTGIRTNTSTSKKGAYLLFCSTFNARQRVGTLTRCSHRRYIFTLEGVDTVVSASSDSQPIVRIPARARHTFRVDDTYEEGPCTIEISTDVSPMMSPGEDAGGRGASSKL
jgi:hypothetical protein